MNTMSHEGAIELVAAYALGAVDGDEQLQIESHLPHCDECRAELSETLETTVRLEELAPPSDAVWEGIHQSIVVSAPVPITESRSRRFQWRPIAVAAAATAVVVGAAAFGLGRASVSEDSTLLAAAEAAVEVPGANQVALQDESGVDAASIVYLPDGTGYLTETNLPALSADRTYQLWAVTEGGVISAGVFGSEFEVAAFQAVGDVSAFVLTDETVGGVVESAGIVVASWGV